jgi:hypothetical protein
MNAMTREEIKAAKRAANVALTAEIRSLVAAGNDDKAIALVADKPASWLQIVTDAKAARDAKAEKAAAKAAAEAEAAAAPVVAAAPVAVAEAAAPVATDVEAIVAAAVAKAVAEALAAVSAAPAPVVAAPVAIPLPVANVFPMPDDNAANVAKGLGRKIAGKAERVIATGDAGAMATAAADARQCAAWCSAARGIESDAATVRRLRSAEASYDKAAARLAAAAKA